MILKLKALIYRLTGIYLAEKEEKAFLKSSKVKGKLGRSLVIGCWQAKHGFYRTYKPKRKK